MKWINNRKTATKLYGAFGLVVMLMLVIAAAGYTASNNINNAMSSLYNDRTLPIQQVGAASTALYTLRGDLFKYVYVPVERNAARAAILADESTIKRQMDLYRASNLVDQEKTALAAFDKSYAGYLVAVQATMANTDAGKQVEAITSVMEGGAVTRARTVVGADLNNIININQTIASDLHVQGDATFTSSRNLLFGATIIGLILAILSVFVITRSITLPLGIVVKISQALARGELGRDLSDKEKDRVRLRKDEIGAVGSALAAVILYLQETSDTANTIAENDLTVAIHPKSDKDELRTAFVRMVDSLRQSISEVAMSASSLGAASTQLASAAGQAGNATDQIARTIQQVTQGITQEAGAVTRTSGTIEQMTRAIDGVAKGAQEQAIAAQKASGVTGQLHAAIKQVDQIAKRVTLEAGKASVSAQDGAEKVILTLQGMEEIRAKVGLSAEKVAQMGQHSEKISIMVDTIEDIASQTNLLALNAAIEAARAGEQGKGFAVVADEVRKLAEKSASATREIGALVKGIQRSVDEAVAAMRDGTDEVKNGVIQANEAGAALDDILISTAVVTQQAGQAADAAAGMSAAAADLVAAVDSVSAVVEENTASTEQMAAGSAEVTQAIESIASVSEENSAAIEEVAASTEEMTAQVAEVSASARSMEEMAQVLADLVSRFRLSDQEAAGVIRPAPVMTELNRQRGSLCGSNHNAVELTNPVDQMRLN